MLIDSTVLFLASDRSYLSWFASRWTNIHQSFLQKSTTKTFSSAALWSYCNYSRNRWMPLTFWRNWVAVLDPSWCRHYVQACISTKSQYNSLFVSNRHDFLIEAWFFPYLLVSNKDTTYVFSCKSRWYNAWLHFYHSFLTPAYFYPPRYHVNFPHR